MRIKIDPLFAFIAGLVLGVILSPFIGTNTANAQISPLSVQSELLQIDGSYFAQINTNVFNANTSTNDLFGVYTFITQPSYTQFLDEANDPNLPPVYTCTGGSFNWTENNVYNLNFLQNSNGYLSSTGYNCANFESGNYYIVIKNLTNESEYYIYYSWNNQTGEINLLNSVSSNRINKIISPLPYGTTTNSNTVNIVIDYKSVAGFDYATLPPQSFGWRVYDAVSNVLEKEYIQNVASNTAFTASYSTTTTLTNGSKILTSFIENKNTGADIEPEDSTFFNVIDNSYLDATGLNSPVDNSSDLTQIDCNTYDVGCQFQKAITFLFAPSQNVLDRFSSIWSRLQYVKPFGYLTNALNNLRGVNNTENEAYTMPEIPFITEIFQPWNNAMSVILWGIFAFVFYNKRLKNIDI